MLNLILAAIAGLLLILITGVGFWYLGGTFADGGSETEATKFRNEGSQIAGAIQLYRSQGNTIGSDFNLQVLVDKGYLSSLPVGWEPRSNVIRKSIDTRDGQEDICYLSNAHAGFTFSSTEDRVQPYSKDETKGVPFCDKPSLSDAVPCCLNE